MSTSKSSEALDVKHPQQGCPQGLYTQTRDLGESTIQVAGPAIVVTQSPEVVIMEGILPDITSQPAQLTKKELPPAAAGSVQIENELTPGKRASLGDYEADDLKAFDFTEKSIRRSFIRKVYAILLSQLLVTLVFVTVFVFHEPTKQLVHNSNIQYVVFGSFAVTFTSLILISCCGELRRKTPHNFIFLGIFTVSISLPLGIISSLKDSHMVMLAIGATALICLSLTLFAFQTKWDFTLMGGFVVCSLAVLVMFGFYAAFLPINVRTALTAFAVLLFSFYLVYDTQMIMGGKHKYTISPEEYVFAALTLYLDIINIFIRILRLLR